MGQRTFDTLNSDTLRTEPSSGGTGAKGMPCLTVLCTDDATRIGARMLMPGMFAGQTIAFGRGDGLFAHSDEHGGRALSDPYVSRKPVTLWMSANLSRVTVRSERTPVAVDGGEPSTSEQEFDSERLRAGITLRLSRHTLLLLHLRSERPSVTIPEIAGDSDRIRSLRIAVERAASHEDPVLICGETGTGKELVARALHARSSRAEGPFVAVNMATLTASTAASALFGHVRGAFTGADRRHHGLFERADGGVLFLDEVGDTPAEVQPMLLRALETQAITPLGAEQECSVDVRVVAATDLDLMRAVDSGAFRSPLLHRLAGIRLDVPSLRDRKDDVGRLAVRFIQEVFRKYESGSPGAFSRPPASSYLTANWFEYLLRTPLSGNVRELRNLARRRALDAIDGRELDASPEVHSPPEAATGKAQVSTLPSFELSDQARAATAPPSEDDLLQALEDHDYVPERAAKSLGLSSSTMHYFMQRSGRVKRATDYTDEELRSAVEQHEGDVGAAAKTLRVSRRALGMALRKRGLN